PARSGSRRPAACRRSRRRASTSPGCCATGWRICGRARVSTRSVAEPVRSVTGLPNLLSLLRVALVPLLVVTLFWTTPGARALAGLFFLLGRGPPFSAGGLARRHGITTALGQLLDPLADKLIVAAAIIMLAAVPPEPRVPAWMAVVVVLRELAVTGLRGIASSSGVL